jgi:hypothetical protein
LTQAHRRTAHCFANRLGVDEVVLVGLNEPFYILCRHQPRFMALLAKSLAEEMRARTGFHPDQVNLHVRSEAKRLCARELFPHHNLSRLAQSNKVKMDLVRLGIMLNDSLSELLVPELY